MRRKLHLKEEKNNNKGFTLVEILATIAIVAVVFGISIFVFSKIISSSKENVKEIAFNNVKEAATLYAKEGNNDIDWFDNYEENTDNVYEQYICVTVKQLINKGYFKEGFFNDDIYKDNNIDDNTVVQIRRDYSNKADFSIKVLPDTNIAECELLAANNSMIKHNGYKKYTDTIKLKIDTNDSSNYSCYISEKDDSESNITAKLVDNNCIYENLKNDKHYISKICLSSENIKTCKSFEVETADFEEINISVTNDDLLKSRKDVTVTYDDTNIIDGNGSHYFITEFNAVLSGSYDVYKCSVNDNGSPNECSNKISDNKIDANQLYKVDQNRVKLTVSEVIGDDGKKITATIADPTGNYAVVSKIVRYVLHFGG